jgi:hypothetical protein
MGSPKKGFPKVGHEELSEMQIAKTVPQILGISNGRFGASRHKKLRRRSRD